MVSPVVMGVCVCVRVWVCVTSVYNRPLSQEKWYHVSILIQQNCIRVLMLPSFSSITYSFTSKY